MKKLSDAGKRSNELYSGHSNCLLFRNVESEHVLGFQSFLAPEDKSLESSCLVHM